MDELIQLIQNYGIIATGLAAGVSGTILLIRRYLMPIIEILKKYNNALDKVDVIFTEMRPNGGSSLKDEVRFVKRNVILMGEKHAALLNDIADPYFEADADGNFIWVNRAFTRLVQRNPSELLGSGWYNAVSERDRKIFVDDWYKAAEQDREISMNLNFEDIGGNIIPCHIRSYKMKDSQSGELLGFLGRVFIGKQEPNHIK